MGHVFYITDGTNTVNFMRVPLLTQFDALSENNSDSENNDDDGGLPRNPAGQRRR